MNICTTLWSFVNFCCLSQSEVSRDNRKVSTFFAFQHVRCRLVLSFLSGLFLNDLAFFLGVLPWSRHRKSSPDYNSIICFHKIHRPVRPLPGTIKYIDHARKLRAQCDVCATNLDSKFTGSAGVQVSKTNFLLYMFPWGASRSALVAREPQITSFRRATIWWGNSLFLHVFFISKIGLKKEGLVESKRVAVILPCLKFNWTVEDWLCYLLSAKEFAPIC